MVQLRTKKLKTKSFAEVNILTLTFRTLLTPSEDQNLPDPRAVLSCETGLPYPQGPIKFLEYSVLTLHITGANSCQAASNSAMEARRSCQSVVGRWSSMNSTEMLPETLCNRYKNISSGLQRIKVTTDELYSDM